MRILVYGGFMAEVLGESESVRFFFIYLWESDYCFEFPNVKAEEEAYSWVENELRSKFAEAEIIDFDVSISTKEIAKNFSEEKIREIKSNVGVFENLDFSRKKFIKKFFKEVRND